MSNLGPQQQKSSYGSLLQIPNGITAQLQQVQDGNGNGAGLWVSSTGIAAATVIAVLSIYKQINTATNGQTVFTLLQSYIPGSNNLNIYIDGVNQIVNESYTETNATTITFSAGLHIGAKVKFLIINA